MIANIYIFIRAFIRHKILHIDDRNQLDIAVSNGLRIGKDCHVMGECIIDPGHCWLISIGDRVTLAPRVHILAHDASTKRELGQTRLGCVSIGDDVFIGAGSIILPGIRIGNKVVIGAGSVVSRGIPDNSVAVGNPARVVGTYDAFIERKMQEKNHYPCFDWTYTIGNITEEKRDEMQRLIKEYGGGYVI